MKCTKCRRYRSLQHEPGVFLFVAVVSAIAGIVVTLEMQSVTGNVVGIALGAIALISIAGMYTAMIDESAWVYSRHKRRGVECEYCGHINPIYPWSV